MTYRVVIAGQRPKTATSYPAAYRTAQELANRHAARVDIEKDCGRLGWLVIEWCEPTCAINKTR